MFRRLRTSQKQRQHSQRHTYKQRGGAPWYQIPAPRAEEWAEPLKQLGFTSGSSDSERMNDYFMALEKQDDLFDAAIKLIAAKLGLPHNYSASDIAGVPDIDAPAKRMEMLAYVDDVEQMVQLTIDATAQRNPTKLQEIRNARDEPLSTLLLFPKRLNNIFVQSLANILIVLKTDQSILKDADRNETMKYSAAVQYDSNVRGNAYLQTARNIRDGFFMSQSKTDFNKEIALVPPVVFGLPTRSADNNNFWVKLLEALIKVNNTLTEADIFKVGNDECPFKLIGNAKWADITAHVFLAYKFNKIDNILQFFKGECATTAPLADDPARRHFPNKAFDEVDVRGTTFKALMSNMEDTMLQYILHLAYTIRKNEPTVLQELAVASSQGSAVPATPTAPPRTDESPSAPQGST